MKRLLMAGLLVATTGCTGPRNETEATGPERAALVAKIDSIINGPIARGKVAGASIAVVKGRDTIAVRAFGKANIELDVPTPPHAGYQIGSVTKQFTAAAVLQLVERGKINLDDDVTKYLPGYNTGGRKIPVRRLLNHTSGIRNYTEIPAFRAFAPRRLDRDTLVALLSKQPFDFEPGDEQRYTNSAFFLAGLIIAKASGMPYEEYVQKHLFDQAGMKDSYYCSDSKIHTNAVTGYDIDSTGLIYKGTMSHQWPYAAGSLCSSAIDQVAWNEALHRNGTILGAAAYQTMITPTALNDGTVPGYGMGIAVRPRLGRKVLHHGGGIDGFVSENLYFPDDSLSVVVLFSGGENPEQYAVEIARLILGDRGADQAQAMDGDINRFAGTYVDRNGGGAEIAIVDGKVTAAVPALGLSGLAMTYLGGGAFAGDRLRLRFADGGQAPATVRMDLEYYNLLLTRK